MPKFWIVIALVTGYLFFMDIPRSGLLDYIPRGLILGALYRDGHLRYHHTNGSGTVILEGCVLVLQSTLRESWLSTECGAFMPKFWIPIVLVTEHLILWTYL